MDFSRDALAAKDRGGWRPETYLALGYPVLPLRPGEKVPATAHGLRDASRDADQVRAWWAQWPRANIAVRCDSICVIDFDPGAGDWPGSEKRQSIRDLTPPLARTPRGGWHVFFRRPASVGWRPSAGKVAPSVDVRTGAGSYIVVAPSQVAGRPYVWVRPLRCAEELPLPPRWLADLLDALARPAWTPQPDDPLAGGAIPEGQRNVELFRLGCRLRRGGLTQPEIEAALLTVNATRCRPPLPKNEVQRISRSAAMFTPSTDVVAGGLLPATAPPALRHAWRHAITHRSRWRRTRR
ncbi:MAG: bifunctional DNA primase/polymerase [Anaerolineae bacterium]|nr:bifunctional DNA primase/polymerase [Anaerolineae bacterium]